MFYLNPDLSLAQNHQWGSDGAPTALAPYSYHPVAQDGAHVWWFVDGDTTQFEADTGAVPVTVPADILRLNQCVSSLKHGVRAIMESNGAVTPVTGSNGIPIVVQCDVESIGRLMFTADKTWVRDIFNQDHDMVDPGDFDAIIDAARARATSITAICRTL
jgi:hypothetical protein